MTPSGSVVTIVVQAAPNALGTVTNVASVSSNGFDFDETNNEDTATTEIIDTIPPKLTLPDDISVQATGPDGATVNFTATAEDDVDGPITPTCSPASGSAFPLGDTSVSCTATDAAGNSQSDSFNVIVFDGTPPAITSSVTGTLGSNGWYVSDVTVTWAVEDPESAISSSSGCDSSSVTTDTTGVTFTCMATSAGGHSSVSTTIKRDATGPTVNFGDPSPPANAAGWHNTVVSVSYTCEDETSGTGDNGQLQTAQEGTAVTVGTTCTDLAGNNRSATTDPFKVDTTPPTVSITSPTNGATFIQNEVILSAYLCADLLSGIASCIGPVLSGSNIDTTALGGQSFIVTGTDVADNTASLTHSYFVITVSDAVVNLINLVESFNLQQGLENSLDAKLSNLLAALDAANAGQRQNGVNLLQAFLNEVQAQRGKKITDEQADLLVTEANRILAILVR